MTVREKLPQILFITAMWVFTMVFIIEPIFRPVATLIWHVRHAF